MTGYTNSPGSHIANPVVNPGSLIGQNTDDNLKQGSTNGDDLNLGTPNQFADSNSKPKEVDGYPDIDSYPDENDVGDDFDFSILDNL